MEMTAEAILKETVGNCQLLIESTASKNGVWGRIVRNFGSEFKEASDRIWMESLFTKNHKGIRAHIISLCAQRNLTYCPRPSCVKPDDPNKRIKVYCICKTHEDTIPEHDLVLCSYCGSWFHNQCLNAAVRKYRNTNSKFKCPNCKGDSLTSFVPVMFRNESILNMTSLDVDATEDSRFIRKLCYSMYILINCKPTIYKFTQPCIRHRLEVTYQHLKPPYKVQATVNTMSHMTAWISMHTHQNPTTKYLPKVACLKCFLFCISIKMCTLICCKLSMLQQTRLR